MVELTCWFVCHNKTKKQNKSKKIEHSSRIEAYILPSPYMLHDKSKKCKSEYWWKLHFSQFKINVMRSPLYCLPCLQCIRNSYNCLINRVYVKLQNWDLLKVKIFPFLYVKSEDRISSTNLLEYKHINLLEY